MSKHPLYLTTEERSLFAQVPEELRATCAVHTEALTTYESPEELHLRQQMFRRDDLRFRSMLNTFKSVRTSDDLTKILHTGKAIPTDVFLDMLFALGAVFLRGTIVACLPLVRTADALEELATLSSLRHALLESNTETISA